MADVKYTCTLNKDRLKQAVEELNEDPKNRLSSVQALRDWIEQQPHLCCRTDTAFLLKYLRTAKFSQLRAREMIEGYLGLKVEFPTFYSNWDPQEEQMAEFFKHGVIVALPGYLPNGQKVLVNRFSAMGKALPKVVDNKFKDALNRYWFMNMLRYSQDENVQVAGMVYILDYSQCPLRVLTIHSLGEARDMMKYQGRIAGRFKGFWFLNEGTAADVMLTIFKPFLKKKMTDRMQFVGDNLENLYKRVPKSMLPVEWLPDDYKGPNAGTFDSLTEQHHADMTSAANVDFFRCESDPKWKIDHSLKPLQPSASFRKLTID